MSLTEFFRRFMVQASLAAVVAYLLILAFERLIPGFAASFVNMPGAGLLVVALLVIAGICARPARSRFGRIVAGILICICLALGGLFLWTRINDLGSLGLLLILSALVLSALAVYAFLQTDQRDTT
jgi:hypothetical protein